MTITVAFGNGGTASSWYLPGSDTSILPVTGRTGAPALNALTSDPFEAEAEPSVSTIFGGKVRATIDEDSATFEQLGAWNTTKNASVTSDGAAELTFRGFVHVDAALGTDSDEASSITLVGAKRGNIATGYGNDRITIEVASNGGDWVNEFRVASGDGNDTVDISVARVSTLVDILGAGAPGGVLWNYTGSLTKVFSDLGGGDDVYISRNNVIDIVQGGTGNDRISLGGGDDEAMGGDGNDILLGEAGNDRLFGGRGADVLNGGAGNDVLNGGPGGDVLTGGIGADLFVFEGRFTTGTIRDRITDLSATEGDKIDLTALGVGRFDELRVAVEGPNTLLTVFGESGIISGLIEVAGRTNISASDFIFGG